MKSAATAAWKTTGAATLGLATGPSVLLAFSFGVFVAPLENEFGWSRPQIMFGATLIAIATMLASPVLGWLIDRFETRRVVLICVPLFAAGVGAMSLLDARIAIFYLLCAMLPFLGIGLWPAAYLRIVSACFEKNLGLATGVANGGIGIGAAAAPLIATALIAHSGWRQYFVGLALLILCVSLPVNWRWLRAPAEARPTNELTRRVDAADDFSFAAILATRNFKLLVVSFFLLGLVNSVVANQIPMFLDSGVSPARAAVVSSVLGLTVIVSRFTIGALLDHVSAAVLMPVVCVGGVVACLIYGSSAQAPIVFVGAVLLGAVYGAEFDVLSFVVKRYFGLRWFGRTYGVVFAVFQLGAAIGVTMFPLARAYTGSYTLGLSGFSLALLIVAVCFVLLGPYVAREPACENIDREIEAQPQR